jgi:small subunit ribosomal protein S16
MAVKIRLRRTGRKKQPSYRIVVADSRTPREGAYLDAVGTYNPLTNPAELRIDLGKVDDWTARGAVMTETVRALVNKARKGGDRKVALKAADERPGATSEVPAEPAAAVPVEPAAVVPVEPAAAVPVEPAAAESEAAADESAEREEA